MNIFILGTLAHESYYLWGIPITIPFWPNSGLPVFMSVNLSDAQVGRYGHGMQVSVFDNSTPREGNEYRRGRLIFSR